VPGDRMAGGPDRAGQGGAVAEPVQDREPERLAVTPRLHPDSGHPVEQVVEGTGGPVARPPEQALGERDHAGQEPAQDGPRMPVPQAKHRGGRGQQEEHRAGQTRRGGDRPPSGDRPGDHDEGQGRCRHDGRDGQGPAGDRQAKAAPSELAEREHHAEFRAGERDRHGQRVARVGHRHDRRETGRVSVGSQQPAPAEAERRQRHRLAAQREQEPGPVQARERGQRFGQGAAAEEDRPQDGAEGQDQRRELPPVRGKLVPARPSPGDRVALSLASRLRPAALYGESAPQGPGVVHRQVATVSPARLRGALEALRLAH
jgi:hypothetical protein